MLRMRYDFQDFRSQHFFKIHGTITRIIVDEKTVYYNCNSCIKKLERNEMGDLVCPGCKEIEPRSTPHWMLLVQVMDSAGSLMLVYFPKEMAQAVLSDLTPQKYLLLQKDSCQGKIEAHIQKSLGKRFDVLINLKFEYSSLSYFSKLDIRNQMRFVAAKVWERKDRVKEVNALLKDRLKVYSELP